MEANAHDETHEAALRAILAAEPPPPIRRLASLLPDCAQCRRELNELERLRRRLDAAGVEERAAVGAARPVVWTPPTPSRRGIRRPPIALLAVAASAALLLLLCNLWSDVEAPAETLLGPSGAPVELVEPLQDFGPDVEFGFRVRDPDAVEACWIDVRGGDAAAPISYEVRGGYWRPGAATVRRWSDLMEWRVRIRFADGSSSATPWRSVRRRH